MHNPPSPSSSDVFCLWVYPTKTKWLNLTFNIFNISTKQPYLIHDISRVVYTVIDMITNLGRSLLELGRE